MAELVEILGFVLPATWVVGVVGFLVAAWVMAEEGRCLR